MQVALLHNLYFELIKTIYSDTAQLVTRRVHSFIIYFTYYMFIQLQIVKLRNEYKNEGKYKIILL